MTRAEQRALEAYPEDISYSTVLERPFDYNGHQRMIFQKAYEQAEKDTIERCVAWLKDNANKYIVDLTETYPDAPVNIIVGGMCWEDLIKYLNNNEQY